MDVINRFHYLYTYSNIVANVNNYRKKWLRQHKAYEKRAYKVFRDVFRKWSKLPFDEMTIFNYNDVLDSTVNEDDLFKAYETVYINIGLTHGKRIGKEVNKEITQGLKFFTLDDFESDFINFIREWLRTNAGENITSIAGTFKKEIRQIISSGVNDGLTIQEITRELQKTLKQPNWYRWQSMRIARTETTTSANLATLKAAENTNFVMDKIWISAHDVRTRRLPDDKYDHQEMHLKQIGLYEMFNVPNNNLGDNGQLLYPADPKGRAGNIINCRCTIATVPKRDKNGNLIPK